MRPTYSIEISIAANVPRVRSTTGYWRHYFKVGRDPVLLKGALTRMTFLVREAGVSPSRWMLVLAEGLALFAERCLSRRFALKAPVRGWVRFPKASRINRASAAPLASLTLCGITVGACHAG